MAAEAKLPVEEEEYEQSFRSQLMDVVNLWTQGALFLHICTMTDALSCIMHCIRRLEGLMRQMCHASS